MRAALLAFLLTRAALCAALLLVPPLGRWPGAGTLEVDWNGGGGRTWLYHPCPLLDAWVRNDGTYYLQIAALGYEAPAENRFVKEGFLPGFPAAVRLVALPLRSFGWPDGVNGLPATPAPYLVAGVIVSNAAMLAAVVLLVRLGRRWAGPAAATRAGVLLSVNPFAFLGSCHLSEGLFLALSLGALLAAEKTRFLLAGLLGGLAAATRILGVMLALPLLMMALRPGPGPDRRLERALAVLLVPLGLVATLVLMGRETGDPWIYFRVQQHYGHEGFPTLAGFADLFTLESYTIFEPARNYLNLAVIFVFGGLLLAQVRLTLRRHLPAAALAYSVPLFVLPLLAGHLISLPRYALVLFPLYLVAARGLPGGRAGWLLAVLSTLAQVLLFLSWEAHQPWSWCEAAALVAPTPA